MTKLSSAFLCEALLPRKMRSERMLDEASVMLGYRRRRRRPTLGMRLPRLTVVIDRSNYE